MSNEVKVMEIIEQVTEELTPKDISLPEETNFQYVKTIEVEPNDYNPNVMQAETFNALAMDITKEGLDQPIVVRKHPNNDSKYIIVDGEHRWRAAMAAGLSKVPIVVKDMDEEDSMISTVRRNMLRGNLNPEKFTRVVKGLVGRKGMGIDDVRKKMAFNVTKEFNKMYRGSTDDALKAAKDVQNKQDETVEAITVAANLSQTVRDIMLNYGDTIAEGYIYFMYKGKKYLMLSMGVDMKKVIEEIISAAHDENLPPMEVADLVSNGLKNALSDIVEGN